MNNTKVLIQNVNLLLLFLIIKNYFDLTKKKILICDFEIFK